jgi:hypothetical protein
MRSILRDETQNSPARPPSSNEKLLLLHVDSAGFLCRHPLVERRARERQRARQRQREGVVARALAGCDTCRAGTGSDGLRTGRQLLVRRIPSSSSWRAAWWRSQCCYWLCTSADRLGPLFHRGGVAALRLLASCELSAVHHASNELDCSPREHCDQRGSADGGCFHGVPDLLRSLYHWWVERSADAGLFAQLL